METLCLILIKNFLSEIKLVKKGDTLSPSIAAASIFAKCARDDLMIKLDKKFKWL